MRDSTRTRCTPRLQAANIRRPLIFARRLDVQKQPTAIAVLIANGLAAPLGKCVGERHLLILAFAGIRGTNKTAR